eukprot:2226717-Pleurochrysis_carterae.AAC.5
MVKREVAEGPQASAPQPNLKREGRPSARADAGGPVRGEGMIILSCESAASPHRPQPSEGRRKRAALGPCRPIAAGLEDAAMHLEQDVCTISRHINGGIITPYIVVSRNGTAVSPDSLRREIQDTVARHVIMIYCGTVFAIEFSTFIMRYKQQRQHIKE